MEIKVLEDEKVYLTEKKFGDFFLNNLQKTFKESYEKGMRAAVLSGTGTGKTLCGMLAAKLYERPLYLVPSSRVLIEEKKKLAEDLGIPLRVSSYDYVSKRMRNGHDLDCDFVVLDEFHEIMRNPSVFEVLAQTEVPFLILSATLSEEFAKKLELDFMLKAPKLSWSELRIRTLKRNWNSKDLPDIIGREITERTLVFFPSRKLLWRFALLFDTVNETLPEEPRRLLKKKVGVYCSDVPREEREEVLKLFEEGRIDAVFATAGLSQGVNLRASKGIIIVTRRRDGRPSPEGFMIVQEAGRIGRPEEGKGGKGEVLIVSPFENVLEYTEELPDSLPYANMKDFVESFIVFCARKGEFDHELFSKLRLAGTDTEAAKTLVLSLKERNFLDEELRLTPSGRASLRTSLPPSLVEEILSLKDIENAFLMDVLTFARIAGVRRSPKELLGEKLRERAEIAEARAIELLKKEGVETKEHEISVVAYALGDWTSKGLPVIGELARLRDAEERIKEVLKKLAEEGLLEYPDEKTARHLLSFLYGVHPDYSPVATIRGAGPVLSCVLSMWLAELKIKKLNFEDVENLKSILRRIPSGLLEKLRSVFGKKADTLLSRARSLISSEYVVDYPSWIFE